MIGRRVLWRTPSRDQALTFSWSRLAYLAAVLAFLAEGVLLICVRSVDQDEGFYLWASKLVYEGKLPYRDFAYPQTPLLPYVYGLGQLLTGRGLYQGRALSLLLACLTLLLGMRITRRLAGSRAAAAVLCFVLLQISSLFVAAWHMAFAATYALTACLILLSVYLALAVRHETARNILATGCLALAVSARLSVAPALLPLGLYLVLVSRRRGRGLAVVAGSVLLTLAACNGPFLLAGSHNMLYDIFAFHTDRMPLADHITSAIYTVKTTLLDYAVPIGLGLVALAAAGWDAWQPRRTPGQRRTPGAPRLDLVQPLIVLMFLGMFAAHLVPRTTGSFYNSLQAPLLNILAALALARLAGSLLPGDSVEPTADTARPRRGRPWPVRGLGWLAILAILALNTILQGRALLVNHLVVLPLHNEVEVLKEGARFLAQVEPQGAPLVTFHPELALEAGLAVPPGFEMSVFGYQPTWSAEQAQANKVINSAMLLQTMAAGTGAVALTDYDLEHTLVANRPQVEAALARAYRWAKTVPGAGPVHDNLRIYLPAGYPPPQPEHSQATALAGGPRLLGYDLTPGPYRRGQPIRFALYWQAAGLSTQSYTVFTHLMDGSNAVVTGSDNLPCRGTCPTTTWRRGEVIRDEYTLSLDPSRPAGSYAIEIGMYDPVTGARLPRLAAPSSTGSRDSIVLTSLIIN